MRLQEILDEAVGGHYLYHGVLSGEIVDRILRSGEIQPRRPFEYDTPGPDRISLTRNQYLNFPYGQGVAQFVIDRDALKRSGYKIVPVVGTKMRHKAETEEQVYKAIPLRAPYVVEIQYDPDLELPESFLALAAEKGIKVTPWRKTKKPDPQPASKPQKQDKFTDPSKLSVSKRPGWTVDGKTVPSYYQVMYNWDDGRSQNVSPESPDERYIKALKSKIASRIAKGLTFKDLLPAAQFGKKWDTGYYPIPPTSDNQKKK